MLIYDSTFIATISIDALPRFLYAISPSSEKILKFKITDSKEVWRQGLTNDYRIYVLKFIEHTIIGKPTSRVMQNNIKAQRNEIDTALLEFCEGNR